MKIAIVVGAFPTISETFILDHITGLIDLGHNVEIFALDKQDVGKVHPEVEKYGLLKKTHYIKIPQTKSKKILNGLSIIFKYIFKEPLVILKCLNIFKYGRKVINFSIFMQVIPFLDKKFDIIHCHFGPIGKDFLFLKDIFKAKFLVMLHGYDMSVYLASAGMDVYNELFKKADLLLPVSEYWKKKLVSLGCDSRKIRVQHMGIKIGEQRKTRKNLNNKIKILTIARFVEKKGLEYSIKAVAKSLKKHPNIEYRIIGDGFLRDELESLISDLNMSQKVKLLGWKSSEEVKNELADADIYLLASVTAENGDQEGIPASVLEAQSFDLPILSTFHTGIPEGVIDGKAGFLVPERNSDALSEKLDYLIEHPEIWPEMGSFGRKYVEEHFNSKKLIKQLENIYKKLLSQK